MEAFVQSWGYLGVFLGIIATGLGFPMPEELPIVLGGAIAAGAENVYWWIMLPVCIVGVILGDSCLYFIGRIWGRKLVERPYIKRRFLPPERLASITDNFQQYGIKILLFARLTPGIRAPIFLTAGITHLPVVRFIVADGIYAIPGVSILFFLGYFFTDRMVSLIKNELEHAKTFIILAIVIGAAGYFLYRFMRRPVNTGTPEDVPQIIRPVEVTFDQMTTKILHPERPLSAPPCVEGELEKVKSDGVQR